MGVGQIVAIASHINDPGSVTQAADSLIWICVVTVTTCRRWGGGGHVVTVATSLAVVSIDIVTPTIPTSLRRQLRAGIAVELHRVPGAGFVVFFNHEITSTRGPTLSVFSYRPFAPMPLPRTLNPSNAIAW